MIKMDNFKEVATDFINLILKTEGADEGGLKLARKRILKIIKTIGARNFVNIASEILKNNFHIEGCNDVRIPLKRIFTISLDELEEELLEKKYSLPSQHPIYTLSENHKDSIKRLKALRFSFGGLNLNKDTTSEEIKDKIKQAQDYCTELDLHIRKEEEILFPALEESGMKEHPQNLREEHKGFREILSKIIEYLKMFTSDRSDTVIAEIRESKEKFISNISNHIFRETFVFYPAALEFITNTNQWEKMKEGFKNIS